MPFLGGYHLATLRKTQGRPSPLDHLPISSLVLRFRASQLMGYSTLLCCRWGRGVLGYSCPPWFQAPVGPGFFKPLNEAPPPANSPVSEKFWAVLFASVAHGGGDAVVHHLLAYIHHLRRFHFCTFCSFHRSLSSTHEALTVDFCCTPHLPIQ